MKYNPKLFEAMNIILLQIFFQFNLMMTGNFGILNFILPVLMLCLLDDQFLAEQRSKR